MNAHGIAQANIVYQIASVVCRCGVRVHGPGAAALAAYRVHRALATQTVNRRSARPPGKLLTMRAPR